MSPEILIQRAEALRPIIEQGLRDGLHLNALQRHTGLSHATLKKYRKLLSLPPPLRKPKFQENMDRIQAIVRMRSAGNTLDQIGRQFGVTRERIRQILAKHCPDQVPGRVATQVACDHCDRLFTPRGHRFGSCCSHQCRVAFNKNDRGWNRDRAETIMRLRNQGLAWSAIADRCNTGQEAAGFRSSLQRHITTLFSSEEQQRYFPGHGQSRFRTPDGHLTSNHDH